MSPDEVQERTKSSKYMDAIAACFDENNQLTQVVQTQTQTTTNKSDSLPPCQSGKVRDRWEGTTKVALVTTDRQSGFDRQLAVVPFKGAVLNLTSAYWFDMVKDIIPTQIISVPHPNVTIAHKCTPFPIEFVVRSYLTGSTDTSIWKHYSSGVRNYCGHDLPDGMVKNQKLDRIICTPTTKEEHADRPISAQDIVKEGWMTLEDYTVCEQAALAIFQRGQELAAERGVILVDTKYEFGKDVADGTTIRLIDEVHTPDSSRWWLAHTYQADFELGEEPSNISKEFLRLWYRNHCDPYDKTTPVPDAPRELVLELSRRYISLYEIITGKEFDFETTTSDIADIIQKELD